jgi:hydrogenase expression/formation protein HypC
MCLGIPGEVQETFQRDGLLMGKVEFGGIVKETCLACVPEVTPGQFVIVHAGFAISQVDEAEAAEILATLDEVREAIDAEDSQPPTPPAAGEDSQ